MTIVFLIMLCSAVAANAAEPIHGTDEQEATKAASPQGEKLVDTSEMRVFEGFFDFYWDDTQGKIWLKLAGLEEEVRRDSFLYTSSLATGLGSNPVGLDRGQLGDDRVVHFRRVGQKVFLIQENWKFLASNSGNPREQAAVRESFANGVLWSGKVELADVGTLVDISDFLLRDAHDCIGTLASSGQGTYSLDSSRSFLHLPRTKAFQKNVEFEAALTFSSKKPGRLASRTAADGKSVTLHQHHSFVQLPDDGYQPRKWDPRVGCFSLSYADYASPVDEPLEKRWITRHRLEKIDPGAAKSKVVQPIVYYLDPGVPEPVSSALLEGARWWNEAFEAAGFVDAFQVKVLPPDADPMDVRFNMIQWVHRATRGWSYGQSVVDPRTGEIIKGHVLLGSLRVRQDLLLFEGLDGGHDVASAQTGRADGFSCSQPACGCRMGFLPGEAYLAALDSGLTSTEVALARIRQLSAHEVGHTLGFAHNFAASTYRDRASVMDYPAPRVQIQKDGSLDLSDAYGVGVGAWDLFTVKYAYSQFSPETEQQELQQLLRSAIKNKYHYISDADARPAGAAHPFANLWDNGSDPVAALAHALKVRRIAIGSFDTSALHQDEPLADLEKYFVPVYLHHRYQVEACAKMLGGVAYSYAFADDGQTVLQPIGDAEQRAALDQLLATIDPLELVIPDRILGWLPPQPRSSVSDRERFSSQTSPIFDRGAAIRAAAELTLSSMLQPQRASRLVRQGAEAGRLGLIEVIDGVFESLNPPDLQNRTAAHREARRIIERVFVDRLMDLTAATNASDDAQQIARLRLLKLKRQFEAAGGPGTQSNNNLLDQAQRLTLADEISRFLARPYPSDSPNPRPELPPGSPIGSTHIGNE